MPSHHLSARLGVTQLSEQLVVGVYGAGGFGREIMPIVAAQAAKTARTPSGRPCAVMFVETAPQVTEVNGYPVISEDDFFSLDCQDRFIVVSVGNSRERARLTATSIARGAMPLTIMSPHAVVYDSNSIGDGTVICAHATITSNARVGQSAHINLYSYVAHDCVVGDFVTFAPNVHCNGNVHIGDHAYLGTGAIIKQGTRTKPLVIGEGAIVGMGAVVTKDVAPHTTVVGNPARPHIKPA